MIIGKQIGFLNAKSTLRELAKDEDKLAYENDLILLEQECINMAKALMKQLRN